MSEIEGLRRIAAVKATVGWSALCSPSYIVWRERNVEEVHCKRCGATIKRQGQPSADYAEMGIEFAPLVKGGKPSVHVTPICMPCRDKGFDFSMLEALYCADLAEWAFEAGRDGFTLAWDMLAPRRVTGWRRCEVGEVI